MTRVIVLLGAVFCVEPHGNAAMDPLFQARQAASRPVAQPQVQSKSTVAGGPLPSPNSGNQIRQPFTQIWKQRPQFLTKGQPISARVTTQQKMPPPPLETAGLKIRRALELQRTFEKAILPPNADNIPLEPGTDAKPGKLENGLTYVILPNSSPPGRFEAHLEIMSGSADEEDRQQGMAHLVEHMTFLGSKKRNAILGTGSKSNAFTDFHQTVFHVDCPQLVPQSQDVKMLPLALALFKDILESKFEAARFVKEKAAVISETQMMNTIEYRLDCHILEWLHAENRLSKRFPIGKKELILDWDLDELRRFHRTHYRPSNAMVYIVGDLDVSEAENWLRKSLDTLPSEHRDYESIMEQALAAQQSAKIKVGFGQGRVGGHFPEDESGPLGEKIEPSLKFQSQHFPPVLHRWSGGEFDNSLTVPTSSFDLVPTVAGAVRRSNPDALRDRMKASLERMRGVYSGANVKDPHVVATLLADALADSIADANQRLQEPTPEFISGAPYNVGLMHHQALQSFSFHIYAKQPISPINDLQVLRQTMARHIAVSALQVRLSMAAKQTEFPISYITFELQDYPREGCNVGSLDLGSDGKYWREAVATGVAEVRRFGLYGITQGEFERYTQSILQSSAQGAEYAAQGAVPNSDMMNRLKESVACHHTWMNGQKAHEACEVVVPQITKDEVNEQAHEITKIYQDFGKLKGEPLPSAIVAGVPPPLNLTNEMVIEAIKVGASRPVEPEPEVVVPTTLMSQEMSAELAAKNPPAWADDGPVTDENTGAIARSLSNGMKVTYMHLPHEPGRAYLRILAPGGRTCERGPSGCGASPGAALVGAMTLQDGGYFDPWNRQQLELFMVENMIYGQVSCDDDSLVIDISFGSVPASDAAVSGMEGSLQILNRILTPGKYIWEKSAFERGKGALAQQNEEVMCSVEGAASHALMRVASNHDERFTTLTRQQYDQVTFDEAREVTELQLIPSSLDIAIVGDIDVQETEKLILKYLGTVPKGDAGREQEAKKLYMNDVRAPAPAPAPPMPCPDRQLRVNLNDPYPRAAGYIAGPAPNRWGVLSDGRHIRDVMASLAPEGSYSDAVERAAAAALSIENEYEGDGYFMQGSSAEVAMEDRWSYPLFSLVVISVMEEIINSRLYEVLRDRKQLTYDAKFGFTGFERMDGAYWQTYVTASPGKVDEAVDACREVLDDLTAKSSVIFNVFNMEPARRTFMKYHENEIRNNAYWAALLAGTQTDAYPYKNLGDLKDLKQMVQAVTAGDLMALVRIIGFGENNRYSCIGVSGGTAGEPEQNDDETGHTLPGVGHSRAKGPLIALEPRGDRVEYFMPDLFVLGFFVLALISLKMLHSFQKSVKKLRERLQEPLIK